MQSLTQELDKLPLDLVLQGVWEGRKQDAFLGGHDAVTTPKVVTSSVIEASVNLVGGPGASLKAETGIRIKISGVKKTTTVGSFPG